MTLTVKTYAAIENTSPRSAWAKGVKAYALELLDNVRMNEEYNGEEYNAREISDALLDGAMNWHEFSWGGCSLIYDEDIATRLCCPSELRVTRNGQRKPNAREEWLDTQARALRQAAALIARTLHEIDR